MSSGIARLNSILERQITSLFACLFTMIRKNEYGLITKKRTVPIIVSMTSYPQRFSYVHLALKSLLFQTVKPDRIILYIDDWVEDSKITPKMLALKKYGVEICKKPLDIKPHKKYYFAMTENPEAIVITVDDDFIYRRDLIERLLDAHNNNPGSVCAIRTHKIELDNNGELLPYGRWQEESTSICEPSHELLATGVGGVLYPPGLLPKITFDVDKIIKYTQCTDDIWLKFCESSAGIKVVRASGKYNLSYVIQAAQKVGLRHANVDNGKNDESISELQKLFNLNWKELFLK